MFSTCSMFLSNNLPVPSRSLQIGLFWNTWRTTTTIIQRKTANISAWTTTMQPDYRRWYSESRAGHLRENKMTIINSMASGICGSNLESITLKLVIQSSSLIIHNTIKLHSGEYIKNITRVGINPVICVFFYLNQCWPRCINWLHYHNHCSTHWGVTNGQHFADKIFKSI